MCGAGGTGGLLLLLSLLGGLLSAGPRAEGLLIALPNADNMTVTVKHGPVNPTPALCNICTPKEGCKASVLQILPGQSVTFNFSCQTPEKYFVMEIKKSIDCTSGPCPFGAVELQPSGLPRLNRTFTWHVKSVRKIGLELSFNPWLRQIAPSDACPDSTTFSVSTCLGPKPSNIGTFCRNGSVSRVKVQGGALVALHLPWNESSLQSGFSIANRSSIKRLCIIESTFKAESSAVLLSASYPLGFPEDELMTWQFVVPPNHRASIQILNYTLPNCEKKEERVEYYLPASHNNPEVFKLADKQPANVAGNFNMSLQSCDLDDQNPRALNLRFKITVQLSPKEGNKLYSLDLTKEKGLTVTIKRRPRKFRHFQPVCLICKGPTDCEQEVNLTSGRFYRLSFLCDNLEQLMVTAEKVLACWSPACNVKNQPLSMPPTLLQLPVQLHEFAWKLIAPDDISAEITSKSLKLQQQRFQEQSCNSSYHYDVNSASVEHSLSLGVFCPSGAIEKIQMRDNVTIVLTPAPAANLSTDFKNDLAVSFVPVIKEECIFRVTPKADSKVYLQTPNWDRGLPDYVSLSWNIIVPPKQAARLAFLKDRMDIVCETGRAYINIKEQKAMGEEVIRRDDELLPEPRDLSHPFWVNISNCKPMTNSNRLKVQFSVVLSQKHTDPKTILIAAVASGVGLLTLGIIVLTICCVRKKKRENRNATVGVYNANVNTQMPGRQVVFNKGRHKNESHIYAVIDDNMVYGHLLDESNGSVTPAIGIYQPFQGYMEDAPPVPSPSFLRERMKKENFEDPLSSSMRDNELYTFAKHKPAEQVSSGDSGIHLLENHNQDDVADSSKG
ncbi:CUB domain-containing protein 1 isoform X2 [Rhinatrema bivittatum]|uniref:CUB domain-containing protein 1 isoform X2 n=1 Tax=Rhinatrema bivittatum TaxID=194408 RepID=UPI00112867A2|nr:CUB domain-containing protein 1 isoform X2 [Rhinatrema bivittatum]